MAPPSSRRERALRGWRLQPALTLQFRGHAPVGLAKRDALRDHQAVGLLGGVNRGIEPDGLAPELQRLDGRRQDGEGLESQVDGAKQRELQQLQVAVVAGGELRAHAEDLRETRLRAGGAAADQLEHIRVALLRHDRGAGAETFRQRDEAELEGGEQQHVGGEAPEVLQQQRDLEQQLRLGLAARELYRGDGLVHDRESEAGAGRFTVDGEPGGAVARRRAQRALVDTAAHLAEAGGVVAQLRRKTSGPQRHRARHGLLLVGVARERRALLARRELLERIRNRERTADQRLDRFAQIQADGGEHLVVARAPEVNAGAGGTDALGQPPLECRLAVLIGELDAPLPARVLLRQSAEAGANRREVLVRQQALRLQHLRERVDIGDDQRAGALVGEYLAEDPLRRLVRHHVHPAYAATDGVLDGLGLGQHAGGDATLLAQPLQSVEVGIGDE